MDMNEAYSSKSLVVNLECHIWLIREFLGPMIKENNG